MRISPVSNYQYNTKSQKTSFGAFIISEGMEQDLFFAIRDNAPKSIREIFPDFKDFYKGDKDLSRVFLSRKELIEARKREDAYKEPAGVASPYYLYEYLAERVTKAREVELTTLKKAFTPKRKKELKPKEN